MKALLDLELGAILKCTYRKYGPKQQLQEGQLAIDMTGLISSLFHRLPNDWFTYTNKVLALQSTKSLKVELLRVLNLGAALHPYIDST
jgi:hypothetical protein